jgi:FtsZ-interacting cell division protein ZipA
VTSYRSGAVLIIAALALFFHSFPTSSQEQQSPTIQAQPQTGSASDQAQNPTISVNTQADKSPSAASEDEAAAKAREEARQIRDVAAQESMAQAAWRMVVPYHPANCDRRTYDLLFGLDCLGNEAHGQRRQ